MKYLLILPLLSAPLFANDIKDFNRVLIENVQQDLQGPNEHKFKVKETQLRGRGPASVSETPDPSKRFEEDKIEKNVKQLGSKKW